MKSKFIKLTTLIIMLIVVILGITLLSISEFGSNDNNSFEFKVNEAKTAAKYEGTDLSTADRVVDYWVDGVYLNEDMTQWNYNYELIKSSGKELVIVDDSTILNFEENFVIENKIILFSSDYYFGGLMPYAGNLSINNSVILTENIEDEDKLILGYTYGKVSENIKIENSIVDLGFDFKCNGEQELVVDINKSNFIYEGDDILLKINEKDLIK